MATMGFFSASLGETCTDCHSAESGGNWAKYADDNPRKNTARAHDRHDERHQQNLLRRKARDHMLLLPSRRGASRRHSQSGGFVRAAAIERAGRTAPAHSAKQPPPIRFSTSTSRPSAALSACPSSPASRPKEPIRATRTRSIPWTCSPKLRIRSAPSFTPPPETAPQPTTAARVGLQGRQQSGRLHCSN